MFRNLIGQFSYFTVQADTGSGFHELGQSSPYVGNLPFDLRYTREGTRITRKQLEPWYSFSASGDVWQERAVHGWHTLEPAMQALAQLKEYNPSVEFRAVRVTISRQIDEVVLAVAE